MTPRPSIRCVVRPIRHPRSTVCSAGLPVLLCAHPFKGTDDQAGETLRVHQVSATRACTRFLKALQSQCRGVYECIAEAPTLEELATAIRAIPADKLEPYSPPGQSWSLQVGCFGLTITPKVRAGIPFASWLFR